MYASMTATARITWRALLVPLVLFVGRTHAAQLEAAFTTASRYDAVGHVVGTIAPDPDGGGALRLLAIRRTYTQNLLTKVENGQLTTWPDETVAPSSWSTFGFTGANIFQTREYVYDGYARVVVERVEGKNGTIEALTEWSYDNLGRVECEAVRMNAANFGGSAANACTLTAEGTQGPDRITRFTYDALDQNNTPRALRWHRRT
jgi:hypothetical protein